MSNKQVAVLADPPINYLGEIDGICYECGSDSFLVYGGAPESYPHGAEAVCQKCGLRRKANLTEIRAARASAQTTNEFEAICAAERERIRTELIDWLIGDLSRGGWTINGRRIVDEIDRICPKE